MLWHWLSVCQSHEIFQWNSPFRHGPRPTRFRVVSSFSFASAVHDVLPCSGQKRWLGGAQAGPGDLQVDHRLEVGLISGVDEPLRVLLAPCVQAFLLPGLGGLNVVGAPAPAEQSKMLLHVGAHG
jgi:hypothetical protein